MIKIMDVWKMAIDKHVARAVLWLSPGAFAYPQFADSKMARACFSIHACELMGVYLKQLPR